jgi:sulfite exporter TauE/SafE
MNIMPWSAALLGVVGSLHCIGMCGPIALALPLGGKSTMGRIAGILAYNFGRTFTYAVLGAFSGLAGYGITWMGGQQLLSIVAGCIILFVLLAGMWGHKLPSSSLAGKLYAAVQHKLRTVFQRKSIAGLTTIGLLNGLLPCGLVYAALLGAGAQGNFAQGALFMLLFGLGTIPAMFAVGFAGLKFSALFRNRLRKAVPVFVAVTALLLILRGMDLGIPYVSPKQESEKVTCCHSR